MRDDNDMQQVNTRRGMTRRSALCASAGFALSPMLAPQAFGLQGLVKPLQPHAKSRCLLLIDLFGGLDGLNALVPYGDDIYYRARPHLAVPAKDVHRIDDYQGFAPAMHPLLKSWEDGRMAVVEGVGYENPNFSHFKSSAIMHRARPGNAVFGDGWIARMRAALWPDDKRAELVTHIGKRVSGAIYSPTWPSLQFDSPESFAMVAGTGEEAAKVGPIEASMSTDEDPTGLLGRLRQVHRDGLYLAPKVLEITSSYEPNAKYPPGLFARKLRTVSALMQADFGTRVFSLTHESFDSHSSGLINQEDVLREFSLGMSAFLRDIAGTSAEENCLVLCTSEFGRRLGENAALGTDHGAAAPVFLFGKSVAGGLHGKHPALDDLDETGNLRYSLDFRSVYASVIDDWFAGRHEDVLLGEQPVPALIRRSG